MHSVNKINKLNTREKEMNRKCNEERGQEDIIHGRSLDDDNYGKYCTIATTTTTSSPIINSISIVILLLLMFFLQLR